MPIEYLDGRRFSQVVVAGADWVRHTREHINRINVFPVADGDTGTNMALSLSATAASIRGLEERSLGAVAKQAAEASILGAKGNSGVIMAHWFLGLSQAFGSRPRAGAGDVASAMSSATDAVYQAIENPVEGTIVTVMKAISECGRTIATNDRDLGSLLDGVLAAGNDALSRTPRQLAVLQQANVVDAGAQGYVNFLEGARRVIRGESSPAPSETGGAARAADPWTESDHDAIHSGAEITERYCTEIVVRGKRFRAEPLKRRFRPLGSSLLVVTTGDVFKLHVHTNRPDEVVRIAAKLGTVEERKVDDMLRQREERTAKQVHALVPHDRQPATVAVACDSTADLPQSVRREHGIEIAPLQVLFGDAVYRDQVDLSTEDFYRKLDHAPHHPTTSQPPPREFVDALDRIRPDREAVVVTISSALSGTYRSAIHGAQLVSHPRVEVFDSLSASTGLGMMTLNAARLAGDGASMDEILHWLARWREDTGLVFSLPTLEYLRRGGRIGAAKSLLGGLLGLQPILTFKEGRVEPLARARGTAEAFHRVAAAVEARVPAGSRVRIGLIEIGQCDPIDELKVRLDRHCEVIECVRGAPTGVIGAHAGPGAWGVFYQRVGDDDPLA